MKDPTPWIGQVARQLRNDLNGELSTQTELRFGRRGSLSVDLQAGRWFDHEQQTGGGVLDLVARENGNANGAAVEWIAETLNIDLRDDDQAPARQSRREPEARYIYQDTNGQPYLRVNRWPGKGKPFSQDRWDGERWRPGTKGLQAIPYRLPELRAAVTAGRTVLIAEGEKDVDSATALGITATTNPGGAGKWKPTLNKHFSGAVVVIAADADMAGRDHAEQVAKHLYRHAASIRVIEFDELGDKADLSDYIAQRRAAGADDATIAREIRQRAKAAPYWEPAAEPAEPAAAEPTGQAGDWYQRTMVGSRGQVLSNLANVVLALSEDPAWRGVLAYDDLLAQPVLMRPVPAPGQPAGEALPEPRPISDADVTSAQHWCQVAGLPSIGRDTVRDAMAHVAQATRRHPLREYLRSLTWDGESRIDRWLVDYLGAPDTAYVRAVARMWMIAAVARVMKPGAKVDHLLVLEGEQGLGKSSACRVLAEPWFGDDLPSLDDQIRAAQYLRGKWIIEVAEMHAFTKAESAKLKSFITQQVEQYIPKYGRSEVQEPRQCVFIATTNKSEYLRDETGGRRFWPVKVTGADVDALARDRDLLWAEAVAAYESAEPWWPSADTERELIAPEQEGRYETDAWEPLIADWLDDKVRDIEAHGKASHYTTSEIAMGALAFERSRIGNNEQRRIGAIMERLGWERRRVKGKRVWARKGGEG